MIYGGIPLKYREGSLVRTITQNKIIRHYSGTDISKAVDLGRTATQIAVTLYTFSQAECLGLEQLLHTPGTRELYLGNVFYKDVTCSAESTVRQGNSPGRWEIDATFIALDPRPYSILSGDPLY